MNSSSTAGHVHPDELRLTFSRTLSAMYRADVPLYVTLLDLVANVNKACMRESPHQSHGSLDSLSMERHGAIRLGTAQELGMMRRLFAVLGMQPVAYYDLALAGIPVHATAFRPIGEASIARCPFRVFTSLLRLELIADPALRIEAQRILRKRQIFTPRCVDLVEQAEREGGLGPADAEDLVGQALSTFRWHSEATVDWPTYQALRAAHPLVADVVSFQGPHINHLTPRVLDIDAAQAAMVALRMHAKDGIEGPPRRQHPILLRQTSFLAQEESVHFPGHQGVDGTHTARFGEIEQRGMALTRKGRMLYDRALENARAAQRDGLAYAQALTEAFRCFPDDLAVLRREGLAFFRFTPAASPKPGGWPVNASPPGMIEEGWLAMHPIVYQDFLPVSAAGIFRSNLGRLNEGWYDSPGDQAAFEDAMGASVIDEFALYQAEQDRSLEASVAGLESHLAGPGAP